MAQRHIRPFWCVRFGFNESTPQGATLVCFNVDEPGRIDAGILLVYTNAFVMVIAERCPVLQVVPVIVELRARIDWYDQCWLLKLIIIAIYNLRILASTRSYVNRKP